MKKTTLFMIIGGVWVLAVVILTSFRAITKEIFEPGVLSGGIRAAMSVGLLFLAWEITNKIRASKSFRKTLPAEPLPLPTNNEKFYETAMKEIQDGVQLKGLWAKAFSDSLGDEGKAKALYVQYRAQQLKEILIDPTEKGISENSKGKIQKASMPFEIVKRMTGIFLVTLGSLLLLENFGLVGFKEASWPVLIVALGFGLFATLRHAKTKT